MVARAIVREFGGPEKIEWENINLPAPSSGEVRVEICAIGVNFIDIGYRRGTYNNPCPTNLGFEASGIVKSLGKNVRGLKVGDRVVTFGPQLGTYATQINLKAETLHIMPDKVSFETAAASFLKAATAEFLILRCAKVKAGDWVLVHAAAGGVGLFLCQWLSSIGARVIGTVSTQKKANMILANGAEHAIINGHEKISQTVRQITNNKGVEVVFDGIGKATWEASLDSLAARGLLVNYGVADAAVGQVDMGILALKGSLFNTRPRLWDYYNSQAEREAGVKTVFEMLNSDKIKPNIGGKYPLVNASNAHEDLESRNTIGSLLLIP